MILNKNIALLALIICSLPSLVCAQIDYITLKGQEIDNYHGRGVDESYFRFAPNSGYNRGLYLRIGEFRALYCEFPYLMDSKILQLYPAEKRHVDYYQACPDTILVLALDGNRIIGLTIGLPLVAYNSPYEKFDESELFCQRGAHPEECYYINELFVEPAYRHQHIAQTLLLHAEQAVRKLDHSYRYLFGAIIERPDNHPQAPATYAQAKQSFIRFCAANNCTKENRCLHWQWPTSNPAIMDEWPMYVWAKDLYATPAA